MAVVSYRSSTVRSDKPLFTLSFQKTAYLFLGIFFAFVFTAVWGALSTTGPPAVLITGATFPLVLGLVFLWGYTRFARLQVRTAKFFEDRFVYSGALGSKDVKYNEIERVSTRVAAVFWVRQPQVLIFLKLESKIPIIIASNPKSNELGADLHNWLKDRLDGESSRD